MTTGCTRVTGHRQAPAGRHASADLEVASGDGGFTLVEVVVALALLGIIGAASATFFISSLFDMSMLQSRQVAVALSNAAVEDARGQSVVMQTTAVAGSAVTWPQLVQGRTQTQVQAQWNTEAGLTALDQTYPAWDPAPGTAAPTLIPVAPRTTVVAGRQYTTSTLIGTCYRATAGPSAPCNRGLGVRTSAPPAGYQEMVRITAVTHWVPAAGGTCSGTTCSYATSTLVDASADPTWKTAGGRAVDDAVRIARGAAATVAVLDNDTIIAGSTNPVTVVSASPPLTTSVSAGGLVSITVPSSTPAGSYTVQYTVRDAYGVISNTATVLVTVA